MANRYNTPANAEFINYYDRLPFQELMAVGNVMAQRYDQAKKDLSTSIDKYSKFNSPSAIDTQQYYDLTVGKINKFVDQAVNNPDLLKSAEGRSQMMGIINNLDYANISKLEQSRDNMLSRQAMEKELSLKGLYNPNWHGMDYNTYSTSDSGIFSDTNLTPYQTIADSVKEYFDKMQASYIPEKSNGAWDVNGISKSHLQNKAKEVVQSYSNTQLGQEHLKHAIASGITTPENAMAWLENEIYSSQAYREHYTRTANPYGVIAAQEASRKRAADKPEEVKRSISTFERIRTALNTKANAHVGNLVAKNLESKLPKGSKLPAHIKQVFQLPLDLQTMHGVVSQLQDTGMFTDADLDEALQIYSGKLNEEASLKLYEDPSTRDLLKVDAGGFVRDYFQMNPDVLDEREKLMQFRDSESGWTNTFGDVSRSQISNAQMIHSSGKLASTLRTEFLDPETTKAKMAELEGRGKLNAMYDRAGISIANENYRKLEKAFDENDGLFAHIMSSGKGLKFSPGSSMFMLDHNDGRSMVAEGKIAMKKSEFVESIKEFNKAHNVDLSTKETYKLLTGDYRGQKDKLVSEIDGVQWAPYSADGKVNEDALKKAPKEDWVTFDVVVPINDSYSIATADMREHKRNFTGGETRKDAPWILDRATEATMDFTGNINY